MTPPPTQPPGQSSGVVSVRLLAGLAAACLLPVLLFAAPPGWWAARNVTNGNTANDYAAVNQGQLKQIATAAFNELGAHLPGYGAGNAIGNMAPPDGTFPGGTGWQLTALINSWSASGTEMPGANTNDYAAVNLGQLKNVASLFYNRLIEAGYTNQYPWLSSTNAPNDYAAANIGQVKNLFSFDVAYSSSGSGGIPDWWETEYFGSGTNSWMSGTAAAPSGNGLTIAQSYATGVSPIDYYNGISPTLAIVSGTNQTSASGTFLPAPLVVQVTGTSSQPMVNAPVTFTVTQGAGMLAPDSSGTSPASGSLQVRTGTDGKAQVCFQQPLDASFTSTVAATAETSEVDFSATTLSDTNAPAAPSNVSAIVQPDGSVQVTWKDNSDNETGFTIQISNDGGNTWTTVGTTGADATSYLVAAGQAVTPGATQINVTATGTGQNSAPSTSGTPTAPLPTINYAVVDISGTYTNVTFNDMYVTFDYSSYSYQNNPSTTANMNMNVLSMALGDDNNAAYCFVTGDYFGMDQFGGYFGGNNQVTVNKWSGGVTSPSALTIACNQPGQNITTGTGASSLSGWRDESLNTDGGLYQSVLWQWIESPYILNYNNYPPSVQLTPQGNAWGTVLESCGFPFDAYPRADAIVIGNVFYRSSGTQQMQINEFTGSSFTTGTTNLVVNNTTHYGNGASLYEPQNGGVPSGPPLGTMLLASSQAGYCGVGMFGMANTNAPGIYSRDDCFTASYISLSGSTPTGTALSGTTIFYDPNQGNNSSLTGRLSQLPSGITKIATPFTPAAMNDYGHAIGGSYYWNGTALVSLGTNSTAAGLNNQNMVIGGSTASGTTTGMLWLENSGTSTPMTMQSLVPQTSGSEVAGIIPYAISNANSGNRVSILCSGSVMETSGTTTGWMNETLLFQVDATTPSGNVPSGTTPGPVMSITKMPASINWFPNYTPAYQKINSNGIISGIGPLITTGTNGQQTTSANKALILPQVELAVDANRDGTIVLASDPNNLANVDSNGKPLPVDVTSQDKPFKFWVNDGEDGYNPDLDESTVQEDLQPVTNYLNYKMGYITCTRDLENLARLWMYIGGMSHAISSGQIIVGLEWDSNTGDATNGWAAKDGTPAINIYTAAPKHNASIVTGGADYLTDPDSASDQTNYPYKIALGSVAKGQPFYFNPATLANLSDSNPKTYFLFEGAARGTGRLVVTFNTVSSGTYTKIGEGGSVYMDLKEMPELYERWTVGDGPASGGGGLPLATAMISQDRLPTGAGALRYSSMTPGLSVPSDPTGNDYILFVHGWNMAPWVKDAFAATMFKRLYWQGYKGKFGAFQWPTTYSSSDLQNISGYDNGEYTAWLSATPLEKLLSDLNGQYNGNVFVFGHSMGNVVTGEALRIAGQAGLSLVNTYIASQAAIPAHCYDPTLTGTDLLNFNPVIHGIYTACGPDTPNIYNNWMMPTQQAMASKVNFYNVNDYALYYWNLDQVLKPDIRGLVYYYASSDLTTVQDLFKKSGYPDIPTAEIIIKTHTGIFPTTLHLGTATGVQDRYEIMAYDSEPRSKALGEVPDAAGFSQQNLQNSSIWPADTLTQPNGPYSAHSWHSAEFLFTNPDMQKYWNTLMIQFGLTPNPLPTGN